MSQEVVVGEGEGEGEEKITVLIPYPNLQCGEPYVELRADNTYSDIDFNHEKGCESADFHGTYELKGKILVTYPSEAENVSYIINEITECTASFTVGDVLVNFKRAKE